MSGIPITESFDDVADHYAAFRPGYSEALFDHILEASPPCAGSVVLNIGAFFRVC